MKCPKCNNDLINKGTIKVVEIPTFEIVTKEKWNCKKCRKAYTGAKLIKENEE